MDTERAPEEQFLTHSEQNNASRAAPPLAVANKRGDQLELRLTRFSAAL